MVSRNASLLGVFILLFFCPGFVFGQDISHIFQPRFTVLYSPEDPNLAMRAAGISDVKYNVATWKTFSGNVSDLPVTRPDEATAGDGFVNRILEAKSSGRTVSQRNAAALVVEIEAHGSEM